MKTDRLIRDPGIGWEEKARGQDLDAHGIIMNHQLRRHFIRLLDYLLNISNMSNPDWKALGGMELVVNVCR